RLLDYYLSTAADAMDALAPAERHRRPRIPAPSAAVPPVTDPAAARAWLDAHRAVLVAVVALAADGGWPGHATRLAAPLDHYLNHGAYSPEAITIHASARRAARCAGDRIAEAKALTSLGVVDFQQGRYPLAVTQLRQALALCRQDGDRTGEARALANLGRV